MLSPRACMGRPWTKFPATFPGCMFAETGFLWGGRAPEPSLCELPRGPLTRETHLRPPSVSSLMSFLFPVNPWLRTLLTGRLRSEAAGILPSFWVSGLFKERAFSVLPHESVRTGVSEYPQAGWRHYPLWSVPSRLPSRRTAR